MENINDQIDAEAKALAKRITKYDPDTDEELGQYKPKQVAYEHIVKYYKAGAIPYGEKLADIQEMKDRYEKALKFIQAWQLPPTGQFWDNDKLQPMSYAACYGSNGERDFMRNVANEALTPKPTTDDTVNG